MRYIDYFDLKRIRCILPEDWLEEWLVKAKDAEEQVSLGIDIDKYAQVWRDFKPALESIIGQKCWYCETIQPRSDKEVDHFRPKKTLLDVIPKHTGYIWLAFNYKNFRYSCQFCNKIRTDKVNNTKGGKGSYFPLIDESKRAWKPGDEVSEKPKLLDPCVEEDVKLLDFNEDGTPCHIPSANADDQDRVKISIQRYHLHHSALVEDRKRLARDLEQAIVDAEYFFQTFATQQDQKILDKFQDKLKLLKTAINITSEYSLFAERYVAGKRNYDWIALVFI
ncbi:hypothetical protein [Nostoc sp. TCL240-02]|uniref:hypothetical protein n=1 Tax=Nostoc sp. TCL240-02 TaxID=2572090 RepID=UPI00157F9F29|nr:hypothetical protein [Nostoc sp. TCL240-02]QKQ73962.1 hypothetical protein FBB35_12005 [Nostoc sp. TCL240-02]